MNIVVILSGGNGTRFGDDTPKQYHFLANKEVIAYSIEASLRSDATNNTIVVAGIEYHERLMKTYSVQCVESGSTRNISLKNSLDYIHAMFPSCEKIFINEAARPFINSNIVNDYFRYLDEYDAVITTQRITDSLGRDDGAVIDRDEYFLIQAPEAFKFNVLYRYFSAESRITATVQQLPIDRKVLKYYDFRNNLKITYKDDLLYAEQIMRLCNGN